MKSILNIKSILIIALIGVLSFVFFGKSFAADTAKVSVGTANVRKTADANATIVEQANKGEEVQIIEKAGEWYKVKYNNIEGYIREDLLDVKNETSTENSNTENNTTNTETQINNTAEKPAEQNTDANSKTEESVATTAENAEAVSTTENKTENSATETTKVEDKTGMYTCKQDTKLKIMPLINGLNLKDIKVNETVNVLEVNNKWAYAESGVNRGWILVSKIEKVTTEQPTENQEEQQQEQQETDLNATMYVNSEVINLRKEATTDSDSLARLNRGTEVIVHSNNDGWSKVTVDGKDGYISS
ncbi:MAG: SH3 domain-containing protein, partial [Clostridia bacterium]|nr:SH3 domain-containing protein [Clostridia bacterium]